MERYVFGVFTFELGELAPWLQAIGSILAIAVAIWLNREQSRAAEKLATRQHQESLDLLAEQNRQTVSRETVAYHRSVADRIIPITALIEHWDGIASHALEIARGHPVNDEFQRLRKSVRGVEATQVDDAIKRIDVQQIPEILLVNEFVRMRHLSALMLKHIQCIKSNGKIEETIKQAVQSLSVNHDRVEGILQNFRERRDYHLARAGVSLRRS
jgi:ABC-type nickel/cobalt efflux system permease component RcnA